MPWLVSVTTEEDVKEDEDVKEQDEEDDEDDEEAEEDKDDGSTHSIVVADLNDHEAPGRTRTPREFKRRNQTNQGKTKAKAKATKTRRRRREGSRIPACHSQIRDQTNYDNRRTQQGLGAHLQRCAAIGPSLHSVR